MKHPNLGIPDRIIGPLDELLDLIKGTGKFRFLPSGIHTYPGRDGKDKVYDACLKLEKLGLIKRSIDEPGHVYWEFVGVDK